MERNLVQVDYEHNYNWYSVSGYRLSDRLILTASAAFAASNPPSGISVTMADQQKIPAVLKWSDRRNGAALLKIDGPSPSPPVTAFQWGELGTAHGKLGCEVRYRQPGLAAVQHFPAFLDPRRRDEEHNYLLADSDGELEVGPDLIGRANVDSAHGRQRLCHQGEPGGIVPLPEQGRGQRPRAPQFGLCQLPQVGFRALAVHVLSVLPEARSSSLAEVLAAAREREPGGGRSDPSGRRRRAGHRDRLVTTAGLTAGTGTCPAAS